MKTISTLSHTALANELDKRMARWHASADAIYSHALHGHERFGEICARLGTEHPAMKAYRVANNARDEVEYEARSRLGPVHPVSYATYLRNLPRRKRAA